jgi:hypothetical protein
MFLDTQESQVTKGGLTVNKRFVLLEVTNNFSSIPCIPRSDTGLQGNNSFYHWVYLVYFYINYFEMKYRLE